MHVVATSLHAAGDEHFKIRFCAHEELTLRSQALIADNRGGDAISSARMTLLARRPSCRISSRYMASMVQHSGTCMMMMTIAGPDRVVRRPMAVGVAAAWGPDV